MKLKIQKQYLQIQISKPMYVNEILQYFHIGKKQIHNLYQNKSLSCHQTKITRNILLEANTILFIQQPTYYFSWIHTTQTLDVVYEDELLLIVNKKPHQIIHSDGVSNEITLDDLVSNYYFQQQCWIKTRAIHRLDKETSGLVIYCKCEILKPYLDFLLKEKQIQRFYYAIVENKMTKEKIEVQQPIAQDRHHNQKMRVAKHGKYAHTIVYPIKTFQNKTLIKCELLTGRTHQIRVHCAYINHPIISDNLYGKPYPNMERCALHAYQIKMIHPLLQKPLSIRIDLAQDMKQFLKKSK